MKVSFIDKTVFEPVKRNRWIYNFANGKLYETKYMHLSGISPFMSMVLHNEEHLFLDRLAVEGMKPVTSEEKEFVYKWENLIVEYGSDIIGSFLAERISKRISKYGISIFSPCADFLYFANVIQLQIVLNKIKNFIDRYNTIKNRENLDAFLSKVLENFDDFYNQLNSFFYRRKVERLNLFADSNKKIGLWKYLRYNDKETFKHIFDVQDSVKSKYEIRFPIDKELKSNFYIPEIIMNSDDLKKQWLNDLESLKENYPGACCVDYSEKGNLEVWVNKCKSKVKNLINVCFDI